MKNKFIHALITLVFAFACFTFWALLTILSPMLTTSSHTPWVLPSFTQLCVNIKLLLFVPPAIAAIYCVYVCVRRAGAQKSWVGFFAATTGTLVFMSACMLVALYLPIIASVNHLHLLANK